MYSNVENNLMYLKLVIVDSMDDIVKEVSIVDDEKIVKRGGEQLPHWALLLEQVEFVIMENSTNVQHETIPDPAIDLMWNNMVF